MKIHETIHLTCTDCGKRISTQVVSEDKDGSFRFEIKLPVGWAVTDCGNILQCPECSK